MNIIIAGTGEVGFYLSKLLAQESHNIVIVDHDKKALERASHNLDVSIINGDATSIRTLEAAGAKNIWAPPARDSRGSAHNRGTCRMGNDPNTSVVDRYHRAHDVPNLFVIDGSNLVTGGRNHPTMTIQALAYRAAEHLVSSARNGEV